MEVALVARILGELQRGEEAQGKKIPHFCDFPVEISFIKACEGEIPSPEQGKVSVSMANRVRFTSDSVFPAESVISHPHFSPSH